MKINLKIYHNGPVPGSGGPTPIEPGWSGIGAGAGPGRPGPV